MKDIQGHENHFKSESHERYLTCHPHSLSAPAASQEIHHCCVFQSLALADVSGELHEPGGALFTCVFQCARSHALSEKLLLQGDNMADDSIQVPDSLRYTLQTPDLKLRAGSVPKDIFYYFL